MSGAGAGRRNAMRTIRALAALGAALVFAGCASQDDGSGEYQEVQYSDEFKAQFQDWVDQNIPARSNMDINPDGPLKTDEGYSWLSLDPTLEERNRPLLTEKSTAVNLNGWRVASTLALVNPPNGWHFMPTDGNFSGFADFRSSVLGHCGSNVLTGPNACVVPHSNTRVVPWYMDRTNCVSDPSVRTERPMPRGTTTWAGNLAFTTDFHRPSMACPATETQPDSASCSMHRFRIWKLPSS
jgi:hypothetical protein